jgi:stearoyl-CoA desaturase (delta-9 desaturase)
MPFALSHHPSTLLGYIANNTDADPHNSTRGFFYSHIGWLLLKQHPDLVEAEKKVDASDLWDDPLVRIQHMCDPWYAFYWVFFFPAQVAYYGWGEDYWNGFFVAGSLRYCTVLHFTFLVNSAAHLWGDRPYDSNSVAADNPIVNVLTGGEGWHNWHHKYPFDYAASEFGISVQWNPSKLFIDIMAKMGLVWGRKRATSAWAMSRERRNREGISDDTNTHDCPLAKKVL